MKANELLKDIYGKFQTGEYLKVPSIVCLKRTNKD